MRDRELQPDRTVFSQACAICGKDISARDPKASISVRYKKAGGATASAHADCLRPLLSEGAKSMLDPDKLLLDAERSDA